jgi:hypothetical protein
MGLVRDFLLIAHFVGLAAILGGFLEQWRAHPRAITAVMVWGARAQVITGLALTGLLYAGGDEPDHVKIAVKLVIALAIAGIAESQRKKTGPVDRAWLLIGVLTLVNVGVAVIWG